MNVRFARRSGVIVAGLATAAIALAAEPSAMLLIVPPGADVASVETARTAAADRGAVLIVGAAERIPLKGGLELVGDRTFADAPPATVVLVLPGDAPGLADFLAVRRKTARTIFFLGDSPLVSRLRGDGSQGALVLVGGSDALAALLGGGAAPHTEAPRASAANPPPTPTPAAASSGGGAVRRYFSSPRPSPTPRG